MPDRALREPPVPWLSPLGLSHPVHSPTPHFCPPGPSVPAPGTPQQGRCPAPCSPALPMGLPEPGPHLIPLPREMPDTQCPLTQPAALLLAGDWPCGQALPWQTTEPQITAGPGRVLSAGFREDQWILSPTTYGFAVPFAAAAAAEWAVAAVAGAGLFSVFRSEPPSPPAPWACSVPPVWRCPWPPSAAPPPSHGVLLPRSGSRENRFNNKNAALI